MRLITRFNFAFAACALLVVVASGAILHLLLGHAHTEAFGVLMSFLALVLFIVAVVMNVILRVYVTGPLATISRSAERVSKGELEVPALDAAGDDEFAALSVSVNRMHRSLGRAVTLLDEGIDSGVDTRPEA